MDIIPPFRTDADPLRDRAIDVDIATALLLLAVAGFVTVPLVTSAIIVAVLAVAVGPRIGRTLGRRLDGLSRSVRFPGVGTLDVHFSTR